MDQKTRRIWAGLVSYANSTATVPEIRATIADCIGLVAATMLSDIFDRDFLHDDLSKEAEAYRSQIDSLLRFLCSEPKSEERNRLREAALEFLREHGEHIKGLVLKEAFYSELVHNLNYSTEELDYFKKRIKTIFDQARSISYDRGGQLTPTAEDSLPLGRLIPSKGFRDLADPICDFLCSQYDRHLNQEVSRKDKKAAPLIPIFVCPSCKKLVMPKRIGRRQHCPECSDRARAEKYRQKASPHEGRDYAWLYRRLHQESGTRRAFLRQQKNQQRLREIRSRQRDSVRCLRLLRKIDL